MKLRTLAVTVAILAALSVVAYLGNRPAPEPAPDPRVGHAVLDPETVARMGSLTVADQGKSVELDKDPSGGWVVAGYYGFPADFDKVSRFVQDLNEAKVERFVTASPDRIDRLDFKDSHIKIKDTSGKDIWDLDLGKTPESGNGRFIRFAGEPRAYFSGIHVWLDTDPKGWADAQLVPVKADDVAKVEFPLEGGKSVAVSRAKKDAPWTGQPGQKVLQDKVSSALTTLTTLRFSDTVAPGDPAAAEAAKFGRTFRLTTFDGRTLDITLGRKPEEKKLKTPVADAKENLAAIAKAPEEKPKPLTPETETIPAGPVFVTVSSSDSKAPINALMKRRAFQVDDYSYTSLPAKADDILDLAKAK